MTDRVLYRVLVDERVKKDLRGVPGYIIDKFIMILGELETDPTNKRPGVDTKKLRGYSDIFRIRIGNYRVFYSVDDENHSVRITAVVHRKKAYRVFESPESFYAFA